MIEIGRYNLLPVFELSPRGALLGTEEEHVFLNASMVPPDTSVGDELRVFVYTDDVPMATTKQPYAVVGEFAFLEVVAVTRDGAFLDWGLPKDLFAPFGRQHRRMQVGDWVVVGLSLHQRTQRVMASSTLSGRFDDDVSRLSPGHEVDLLVYGFNEVGVRVIVNGRHAGLVYHDFVYQKLRVGDKLKGYVALVRDDHRLDITLQQGGMAGINATQKLILDKLDAEGGFLPLHDKSSPLAIEHALGVSKKSFKKAVGALYKARLIELTNDGIRRAR
ncbi:MAG: GntR family transcriptional regulator [Proteobacteria bacterium]|nr:GntR family transcriptional regulator [Pseudomonadota bacterium]